MKKKWLAVIALLLIVAMILPGCNILHMLSKNQDRYDNFQNDGAQTDDYGEDWIPEEGSENSQDEFGGTQGSLITDNGVYITDASDFKNGYAWVRLSKYDNSGEWVSSQRCAIDTSGNVVYAMPEVFTWTEHRADFTATPFVNEVAIVNNEALVSTDGRVIWSVDGDGWSEAEERFGEGNVENVIMSDGGYFRGYAFVYFEVETFEETAIYSGVLDSNGDWYVEPTKDFRDAKDRGDGLYTVTIQNDAGYYSLNASYNVAINKISRETDEVLGWCEENALAEHNGLLFDEDRNGFYDASGKIVIDLSEYKLWGDDTPTFYDGYCVIDIQNKQGSVYFTVIDTSGKRMFEPQKHVSHDYRVGDGLLRTRDDQGNIYYLNMAGETVLQAPGKDSAESFHDGLCLVKEKDTAIGYPTYYYMDTAGQRII